MLPRLIPAGYGGAFVGLMLLVDLLGLVLLARLGRRSGNDAGVWVWLLGLPLLGTFAVLRFDLVPTVIAIAALIVIHRRPQLVRRARRAGAASSSGRRCCSSAVGPAAAAAVRRGCAGRVAVGSRSRRSPSGGSTGLLSHGGDRGLQEEAVATAPWQLDQIVSGDPYQREIRSGAWRSPPPPRTPSRPCSGG